MLTREEAESLARERFERLAEGKPFGLMRLGLLAAIGADDVYAVTKLAVLGGDGALPGLVRLTERSLWFYSDASGWRRELLLALGVPERRVDDLEAAYGCLLSGNIEVSYKDWPKISRLAGFFRKQIDQIQWEDQRTALGKLDWGHAVKTEAVAWFFRTAFPCWILYGRWPWQLVADVSGGIRDAMQAVIALVQIDKRSIHLPVVREFLHDCPRHLVDGRIERVSKSWQTRPRKITRKQLKYRIGRLIQELGTRLACPLNEPDITELFCCARLINRGELADSDLAVGSSMTRSLNRENHHWHLPPVADMETLERVRALRGHFA